MIRFRLRERLADHSFKVGKRVTLEQVAEATGIHRATLSKIASPRGSNTTTDNLDKLCRFFECSLAELAEYVPDKLPQTAAPEGQRA
ncbi:MAG: helix-turn-helix domain-containing protein [Methylibium sp.]|uniref:helix-turn-helix domain-containing protein n=1 Tax=Methylibium sp. TaxID=2067992 RepID=UPI0018143C8A|nr:helix-turn-helix domain-containing protein [Methylibium sp.]MBA2722514.1 helix-turn-helix domain-containing protein [Methylibium sp.]MBA3589063.1 helix-turn-helix domain-containing protein [Methylibium sp.]